MFLRIVPIRRPSKKKVHYVRLVESYYNRGKIKQQTIANLRRRKLLAPHVDQLVELLKGEPRKTMTEEKHLSAVEAVGAYKELSQVERAFRKLKDVLEMRPIYHHDPQRVQVHVFVAA
ncbi:transposase, partial [Candidatus Methylacidiphilum fumarolicum]|uniref:transposase n=1 Tax=Candidatus Methylacidiphilum fumarolicum TaxID=591154 RepID=UPI000662B4F3